MNDPKVGAVDGQKTEAETGICRVLRWKNSPVYWPALSTSGSDTAPSLQLKYMAELIDLMILSPEEWSALLASFSAHQHRYFVDGYQIEQPDEAMARICAGFGITTYVRTYNHQEYLLLQGSRQQLSALLDKLHFAECQPQILKIAIGALSIEQDMSLAIHMITPMEILIGSSLRVLQYLLNDDALLHQLGFWHARLLSQSITMAGTSLALHESFPVSASVGLGLVLVSVAFPIGEKDRTTAFERQMIQKMSEVIANESVWENRIGPKTTAHACRHRS